MVSIVYLLAELISIGASLLMLKAAEEKVVNVKVTQLSNMRELKKEEVYINLLKSPTKASMSYVHKLQTFNP